VDEAKRGAKRMTGLDGSVGGDECGSDVRVDRTHQKNQACRKKSNKTARRHSEGHNSQGVGETRRVNDTARRFGNRTVNATSARLCLTTSAPLLKTLQAVLELQGYSRAEPKLGTNRSTEQERKKRAALSSGPFGGVGSVGLVLADLLFELLFHFKKLF
jgi:hypothetical protein